MTVECLQIADRRTVRASEARADHATRTGTAICPLKLAIMFEDPNPTRFPEHRRDHHR
jgi:hypothetical protein